MSQKKCNKCSEWKELLAFGFDKRNKDGLQGICEVCRKAKKQADRRARIGAEIIIAEKWCNKCEVIKPSHDFYKDAGIADGLGTICKDCRDISMSHWRENNREQYNADMRLWRAENKDAAKSTDLMRCYGISLEDYNNMLTAQNGACAICKKPPKGKRPLVVDHCHGSEKVRDLLCYGCNRLIVSLDDHPLHNAIVAYLTKHK